MVIGNKEEEYLGLISEKKTHKVYKFQSFISFIIMGINKT